MLRIQGQEFRSGAGAAAAAAEARSDHPSVAPLSCVRDATAKFRTTSGSLTTATTSKMMITSVMLVIGSELLTARG